ncbi:hypothetical protein GJ744_004069 [Endocarpon pusillum]|uniref:Uncharacterized protein n=1 Tax=Endocarpon pusillum TaxID=364733 RepID=A0A8H7A9U2_9EURO|nr:hypothetical protein GJ744_004069 [Endocarpon pusillum]
MGVTLEDLAEGQSNRGLHRKCKELSSKFRRPNASRVEGDQAPDTSENVNGSTLKHNALTTDTLDLVVLSSSGKATESGPRK